MVIEMLSKEMVDKTDLFTLDSVWMIVQGESGQDFRLLLCLIRITLMHIKSYIYILTMAIVGGWYSMNCNKLQTETVGN